MPKRGAIALGLTAVALALLLNFQTPAEVAVVTGRQPLTGSPVGGASGVTGPVAGGTGGANPNTTGDGAGSGSSNTGGSGSGVTDPTAARTVQGPTVNTRWGPVQVAITVQDGRLVDVSALELPVGGRSGQISSYVAPILRSEALAAQGANIDGVSGATFTSVAYARSLQAALDSAGI
jgi:hypothetical protein